MCSNTFPYDASREQAYLSNPAIRLLGNRFSNDQTPMELVSEFMLVANSLKRIDNHEFQSFLPSKTILSDWQNKELKYSPKARLNLKLISFLSASRLDSRHTTHRQHYKFLIDELRKRIRYDGGNKTEVIKTIENLLLGFQGAGNGRTWCAQSFIPMSKSLLSSETIWKETKARKDQPDSWNSVINTRGSYFSTNQHVFLARGGELLYLQVCNSLNQPCESIQSWAENARVELEPEETDPAFLLSELEIELGKLFERSPAVINDIAEFIDQVLDPETALMTDGEEHSPRYIEAGWCNRDSWQEGYLLAVDILRILKSGYDVLDSIYYLESLFTLHILRSIATQSARTLNCKNIEWPGYYMAITAPNESKGALKRISHQSLKNIEKSIFMAIRTLYKESNDEQNGKILKEADSRSGHKFFLKIAKQTGLVIPRRGAGARFVLTPQILRLLVTITVPNKGRITFDTFKNIVRTRWGIVFDDNGFGACSKWVEGSQVYLASNTDAWLIEMLDAGGLLMHLSDSCALVLHPNQEGSGVV